MNNGESDEHDDNNWGDDDIHISGYTRSNCKQNDRYQVDTKYEFKNPNSDD